MQRKALMQSHIFLIILAAAVFLLLLYFGWGAINDMNKHAKQAQMVQFKAELSSIIDATKTNLGAVKVRTFRVPKDITRVCLVNVYSKSDLLKQPDLDPIIREGVEADYNLFLFGHGVSHGYFIGPLIMDEPYYRCFDTGDGWLVLSLEGAGNSAILR